MHEEAFSMTWPTQLDIAFQTIVNLGGVIAIMQEGIWGMSLCDIKNFGR
jgi:hypothetical protein